ncbi:MAG TPA: alpha/beta hydrolase [Thermoanaerobaculia bacterium]
MSAAPLWWIGAALFSLAVAWFLITRQRVIVFKPAAEMIGDPSDVGLPFEEVQPRLAGGSTIHGWWVPRDGSRRVIICLPGSVGNISHELRTVAFLHALGASVLIVDYPGFGRSPGRARERGCYEAAEAAWEFATREKGVDTKDVIAFGRSTGGTVAAWLAARHPDCGLLIVHSAFTSVPDVAAALIPYFPVRYFCYIRFNTLRYIRMCRMPIVVMHSSADTHIPAAHSLRILAAAPEPKQFIPLRGNHYGSEWQQTSGLRATLTRLVMGGGPT